MYKKRDKHKQCDNGKCPYLYNEEYCLISENYIDDMRVGECGLTFDEVADKNNNWEYDKE